MLAPITPRQRTETAILLALVCLLLAWVHQQWAFVWLAFAILLLSLLIPSIFHLLAVVWFGLARAIGFLVSHALLTLLFFLLVTPVGLVRRWIGKDSLQQKSFKKSRQSVLKVRDHPYEATDLKHPF